MIHIEICANGYNSAMNAQKGGANRIELCEMLEFGGLTPSNETLMLVRENISVPVHILIRPKKGDFIYSNRLKELMINEIRAVKSLGFKGIVIGVLDKSGQLDLESFKMFLEAASPLEVTFHRAIDEAADPMKLIGQLINLGVKRVLTSGSKPTAWEGRELIATMQKTYGAYIEIMAGSGITSENVLNLINATKVNNVHLSAKRKNNRALNQAKQLLYAHGESIENWQMESDEDEVNRVVQLVKARP